MFIKGSTINPVGPEVSSSVDEDSNKRGEAIKQVGLHSAVRGQEVVREA